MSWEDYVKKFNEGLNEGLKMLEQFARFRPID
jgi:hypothetical protein